VTPVEGKTPKTAFTGWFMAAPNFTELRREWLTGSNEVDGLGLGHFKARRPSPADTSSIPPEVVALARRDEMLIASIATGGFHGLNATAARMWDLMGSGKSLHRSALALAREYEVGVAVVEHDLIELAANLASRQLITLEPRTAKTAYSR
jgi:Coenzyme PQQ synthesis protein D (PqqD)